MRPNPNYSIQQNIGYQEADLIYLTLDLYTVAVHNFTSSDNTLNYMKRISKEINMH